MRFAVRLNVLAAALAFGLSTAAVAQQEKQEKEHGGFFGGIKPGGKSTMGAQHTSAPKPQPKKQGKKEGEK